MKQLEPGTHVLSKLPDFVSKVFYRRSDIEIWQSELGLAFHNSLPNSPEEIRLALTWLVEKLDGTVTWPVSRE